MQTVVHVYCSRGRSLRDAIAHDVELEDYRLTVVRSHQAGRNPGWLKLHSTEPVERPGAVNVEWNRDLSVLTCRVVTKGGNRPAMIVSDLVDYLLARHWRRLQSVTISPRA
jgi:hypothetical protein